MRRRRHKKVAELSACAWTTLGMFMLNLQHIYMLNVQHVHVKCSKWACWYGKPLWSKVCCILQQVRLFLGAWGAWLWQMRLFLGAWVQQVHLVFRRLMRRMRLVIRRLRRLSAAVAPDCGRCSRLRQVRLFFCSFSIICFFWK